MTQPTVQSVRTAISDAAARAEAVRLAAVKAAQDLAEQRTMTIGQLAETQQAQPKQGG